MKITDNDSAYLQSMTNDLNERRKIRYTCYRDFSNGPYHISVIKYFILSLFLFVYDIRCIIESLNGKTEIIHYQIE